MKMVKMVKVQGSQGELEYLERKFLLFGFSCALTSLVLRKTPDAQRSHVTALTTLTLQLTPQQLARQDLKSKARLLRAQGDNRGWQLVLSAGVPVWQWIRGGKFQPVTRGGKR
jgi:hypothetical protein